MEREIKFRGMRYNGSWVYGDLCTPANRFVSIRENKYTYNGVSHEEYEVDEETIGQFSGLTDNNGKDIYEHDILRVFDGKNYFKVTVVWSDEAMAFMCCFCDNNLSPLSWFSNILSKNYKIEVIGNKFDNPGLLED